MGLLAAACACVGGPSGPSGGGRFALDLKNSTLVPCVFSEIGSGASFTVQALDDFQIARAAVEGAEYAFVVHPVDRPAQVSEPARCVYRARRERSTVLARRVEWDGTTLRCSLW